MFTITKNVEVLSNGQRILLEANDMIDFDMLDQDTRAELELYFNLNDAGKTEEAAQLANKLHAKGVL